MNNTALLSSQPRERTILKQVKVSVAPDVATAFKSACAASSVSMAAKLSQFMADYSKITQSRKTSQDFSTRRQRRNAIKKMIKQLEQIRSSEEEFCDRIPDNLQSSIVFDRADELIALLDEVIELLDSF